MFLCFLLTWPSNCQPKRQSGQFEGGAVVGGQLVPVTYTYTVEQEPIFQSKRFLVRSARVLNVLSPNLLRVDIDGRQREITLIGLMDFSLGINGSLRDYVIHTMNRELSGAKGKLYFPRNAASEGLGSSHAYLMVKENLINHDLLQRGMGILPENQAFYGPLLLAFEQAMQNAAAQNLGIWGRQTTDFNLSEEELSRHGIVRE